MRQTTSLKPPTSDGLLSRCSKRQPRSSAKRWYIRSRSPANREASSPPVPARISMMASRSSVVSRGSRLYCTSLRSFSRAASSSGISRAASSASSGSSVLASSWLSASCCSVAFRESHVSMSSFRRRCSLMISEAFFWSLKKSGSAMTVSNSSRRWRRFSMRGV